MNVENVWESHKFIIPEREYQIPENHIPGIFGNIEFPKIFHSRTSGFPKQKNSEMAPPYFLRHCTWMTCARVRCCALGSNNRWFLNWTIIVVHALSFGIVVNPLMAKSI